MGGGGTQPWWVGHVPRGNAIQVNVSLWCRAGCPGCKLPWGATTSYRCRKADIRKMAATSSGTPRVGPNHKFIHRVLLGMFGSTIVLQFILICEGKPPENFAGWANFGNPTSQPWGGSDRR